MIDHLSTYATDYVATKLFYEKTLACLGHSLQSEFVAEWNGEFPTQRICALGPAGKPTFWIIEVKQKYTPRHVAFAATSRNAVNDFYAAALAHGGKDNGAPGRRPVYHASYYGAFTLDPDGNNVEAVCHMQERKE